MTAITILERDQDGTLRRRIKHVHSGDSACLIVDDTKHVIRYERADIESRLRADVDKLREIGVTGRLSLEYGCGENVIAE